MSGEHEHCPICGDDLCEGCGPPGNSLDDIAAYDRHIDMAGSKIAELEAENARLRERLDTAIAEKDQRLWNVLSAYRELDNAGGISMPNEKGIDFVKWTLANTKLTWFVEQAISKELLKAAEAAKGGE